MATQSNPSQVLKAAIRIFRYGRADEMPKKLWSLPLPAGNVWHLRVRNMQRPCLLSPGIWEYLPGYESTFLFAFVAMYLLTLMAMCVSPGYQSALGVSLPSGIFFPPQSLCAPCQILFIAICVAVIPLSFSPSQLGVCPSSSSMLFRNIETTWLGGSYKESSFQIVWSHLLATWTHVVSWPGGSH